MKRFIKIILSGFLSFLFQYSIAQNGGLTYQWAIRAGDISNDEGQEIVADDFRNVFFTGTFSDTVDFDPGTAKINLSSPHGIWATVIAKYNSTGNLCWAKELSFNGVGAVYSLQIDRRDNLYIAGIFQNTVDFDLGPDTAYLTAHDFEDAFIAKYDSSGNFIWVKNIDGGPGIQPNRLQFDSYGSIYLGGTFM